MIKLLRLTLMALLCVFATACVAAGDDDGEDVGETKQALCASYPRYGAGDGDGSGAISGGYTGYVTQMRVSPAYDDKIEITQTKFNGSTVVGTLDFGAAPVGPRNIAFIRAKSPGWTGSLTNKLVKINRCISAISPTHTGCDNHLCNEPAGHECLFMNDALAFTWQDLNTATNPGGAIIPSTTSFPLGVTGIWGTAPAEPSHFRIFALSAGGPGSWSTRWTFLNGTTCP
jgi:hypothetical protein